MMATADRIILLVLGLLLLGGLFLAYSNHFHNSFHFDDSHAIQDNLFLRDLRNIPLFFRDGRTFSALPANQTFRPLLSTTFALDYRAGNGSPFPFHVTTFVLYILQLATMVVLFVRLMDTSDGGRENRFRNRVIALLSVGVYALHPACAETINYICARSDSLSTLTIILGLALYTELPDWRKFGLYLVPPVLGMLVKATTVAFAPILFCYVALFSARSLRKALCDSLPAFIAMAGAAVFVVKMNPPTFTTGGASLFHYVITQPFVVLHYFRTFFVPNELSADTDWAPFDSISDDRVWVGCAFIGALIWGGILAARRPLTKPIAFGIAFFLLGLLPTSLTPLSEVLNDHRMFLPFVGLALSFGWAAGLLARKTHGLLGALARVSVPLILTAALGWGTFRRNEVWKTEETLWRDVTEKSPTNGRGLMNYGLTQMAKGKYDQALRYFNEALVTCPNYPTLEVNLGIVEGALRMPAEAEAHFQRAIALAPEYPPGYVFYARWLDEQGTSQKAIPLLEKAIPLSPASSDARELLMDIYAKERDWQNLKALATKTLSLSGDAKARKLLDLANSRTGEVVRKP